MGVGAIVDPEFRVPTQDRAIFGEGAAYAHPLAVVGFPGDELFLSGQRKLDGSFCLHG